MTTYILLSIPVLLICGTLYFVGKRLDQHTEAIKQIFEKVKTLDLLTNYAIADSLCEIKKQLDEHTTQIANNTSRIESAMIINPL